MIVCMTCGDPIPFEDGRLMCDRCMRGLEVAARPHMGTRDPMPIPALATLLGPDRPASVTRLEAIVNGPHPLSDDSRALIAEYCEE